MFTLRGECSERAPVIQPWNLRRVRSDGRTSPDLFFPFHSLDFSCALKSACCAVSPVIFCLALQLLLLHHPTLAHRPLLDILDGIDGTDHLSRCCFCINFLHFEEAVCYTPQIEWPVACARCSLLLPCAAYVPRLNGFCSGATAHSDACAAAIFGHDGPYSQQRRHDGKSDHIWWPSASLAGHPAHAAGAGPGPGFASNRLFRCFSVFAVQQPGKEGTRLRSVGLVQID